MLGEEGERPLDEGGDGGRAVVVEELGVAEAAVVVDDRVRVVVADPLFLLGARAVAVAGDGVAGTLESGRRG